MPTRMKAMRKKRSESGAVLTAGSPGDDRRGWGRRSMRNAAAAIMCVLLLVLAGCGDERKKADAAAEKGWVALGLRNPQAARDYFAFALKLCPTLPRANLGMAKVYDQYFFDNKAAIVYYKRYLDLVAGEDAAATAVKSLDALEAVDSGRLEDPASAVEDLLGAAYAGRKGAFFERVSGEFLHALAVAGTQPEPLLALFGSFNLGGRPEVVFRMINEDQRAAIVVVALKGTGEAGGYIQLALLRGSGEQRNSWHLANYQRLSSPTAKP